MASLKQFFSQTIPMDKDTELPFLNDKSIIITQVALTQPLAEGTRASLTAHIETLQIGKQDENDEIPSKESDVIIAHFFPGNSLIQQTSLGFTNADIVYIHSHGAEMVVSGYYLPAFEKLSDYAQ